MRPETFDALAVLVAYPREGYRAVLAGALPAAPPSVESELGSFRATIEPLAVHELEEAFTSTFDLDPVAALEVGWHLHGDTYERGRFLVEMRQRLHRLGLCEQGELPDHLATVLRVLPRLEAAEGTWLAREAVMPALAKILEPLRSRESIFLPLLEAVVAAVEEAFGCGPSPEIATAAGTGCAGPSPDPAHVEKRTAAGGPYAGEDPPTASHDLVPEVTA